MSSSEGPQAALFTGDKPRPGPIEAAFARALAEARKSGRITAEDSGTVAHTRYTARLMDAEVRRGGDAYRWQALSRELRALMTALTLTPEARGAAVDDPVESILAELMQT